MIKSMTAYGNAVVQGAAGRVSVELQSVNRRFLDVLVQLPPELGALDFDVRKWVSAAIQRGQVTVRVSVHYSEGGPQVLSMDRALAKQIVDDCRSFADEEQLSTGGDALALAALSRMREIWAVDRKDDLGEYRSLLQQGVEEALRALKKVKREEGKAMVADMLPRIAVAKAKLKQIEPLIPESTAKYEQRLRERLQPFWEGVEDSEERALRELCLFADKLDVSEELARCAFHLDQLESLLKGDEQVGGKRLDFLLQETNREVNTIGSKSAHVEIASLVVDMKAELEKVREQVQNLE
jgi:uncharacterized protein (TIGR00255 family)